MIALDASVLIRCLTLDDPGQVPAATARLAHGGRIFGAKTVLLALERVVRAAYKLTRPGIHSAPGKSLGLPNLTMESPGQISQAIEGCALGLEFADALHLAAGPADEGLFTFDARFASVATAAGHRVQVAGRLRAGWLAESNRAADRPGGINKVLCCQRGAAQVNAAGPSLTGAALAS